MMYLDDVMIMAFPDLVVIKFLEIEDGRYRVSLTEKVCIFIFPEFTVGK